MTHQREHRQGLEVSLLRDRLAIAKRGQICGVIVALGALGAAVWCAKLGQPTVGAVIAGADLVGFAAVFMTGQRRHREQMKAAQNGQ